MIKNNSLRRTLKFRRTGKIFVNIYGVHRLFEKKEYKSDVKNLNNDFSVMSFPCIRLY